MKTLNTSSSTAAATPCQGCAWKRNPTSSLRRLRCSMSSDLSAPRHVLRSAAVKLRLFLLLACVYMAGTSREPPWGDAHVVYETTQQLVDHGRIDVNLGGP